MKTSSGAAWGLLGAALAWTTLGLAQNAANEPPPEPGPLIEDVQTAFDDAEAELAVALDASTADCATACRALASLRRSAESLCALDPGPPCDSARERLERARDRVAARCPNCEVAASTPREPEAPADDQAEDERGEVVPEAASAPGEIASDQGRGCAACRAGRHPVRNEFDLPGAVIGWGLVGAAILRRRRRRRPLKE
ncbi:MAG: hypothetical protein AAGN82_01230 [Myxococcota bacterium]